MTEFLQVDEFKKDLEKLNKKYKSLNNDLKSNFCEVLDLELPNHLPGTFRISGLGEEVKVPIYKLKHFRCQSLKGKGSRSGIRVIYAYDNDKDKVTLIEIYYKINEKRNHDKKRILKYFS
jgi:mRNA-degrading endonuclease RelE of RelBE toxin-antitoxin system